MTKCKAAAGRTTTCRRRNAVLSPLPAAVAAGAHRRGHRREDRPHERRDAGDAIQLRTYERNQVRDENFPGTKATDAGKMKAAGAGVALVADPAPAVVVALP
jgi:hypothetical protein